MEPEVMVYLITGFMDSGKTSLILETMGNPDFATCDTLIIACEDGEVEYEDADFAGNVTVVGVESEEELNDDFFRECEQMFHPDQVFIEYNGTWQAATLLDCELPKGWVIAQTLTTVDASTFELYLTNMRTMMMEQVFQSDLVIFNRCNEETPKASFRRIIKARNMRAQIVYELEDGTIDESDANELPYDIDQDVIEIDDMDWGIFYLDIQDDPKKYDGKTVKLLTLIYRPEDQFGKKPLMVAGRFAMTCCIEDIQFVGFKCKYKDAPKIEHKSWAMITADIRYEFAKEYRGRGPVLYVTGLEAAEAPADGVVTFS